MEEWRPRPDETEATADAETRRSDFVTQWLRRRNQFHLLGVAERQQQENADEEDDDEEESFDTSVSKKLRRFLGKLFRRELSAEPEFYATLSESVARPHNVTFDERSMAAQAEQDRQQVAVTAETVPLATANVASESAQEVFLHTPREATFAVPVEVFNRSELSAASSPEPAVDLRHSVEHVRFRVSVAERREPLGALATALVGAEFLARRQADRRQERKLTKEIKQLERKVEQGKVAQVQLERIIDRTKRQVDRQPARVTERHSEVAPYTAERPVLESRPESRPIRPEASVVQREVDRTTPERRLPAPETQRYTEPQVQPEIVLEKVAEAAERNAPIERAYERRQEVKDESTAATPVYGGATSIGAVLASSPATNVFHSTGAHQNVPSAEERQNLYRQAAHRGFWGAIVIVIAMLLALTAYSL